MKVAAIQLTTTADIETSLAQAEALIRDAASNGARYILTPEVTDLIIDDRFSHLDMHFTEEKHPGIPLFSGLAKELNIYLLAGSFFIFDEAQQKFRNRSYLFDPSGNVIATYDKIHLYNVDLPTGESHRESNSVIGGQRMVLSEIEGVNTGLSICYDMRFPHLYRDMAKLGADIISVPAAFTVPTGQAHWHTLLRARAIESGAFIIAPAQVGQNTVKRATYGHSLIIDPWGAILAEAMQDEPCFVLADLDFDDTQKVRQAIPSLQHDQEYTQ